MGPVITEGMRVKNPATGEKGIVVRVSNNGWVTVWWGWSGEWSRSKWDALEALRNGEWVQDPGVELVFPDRGQA